VLSCRGIDRGAFFRRLRAGGLGVNVHYIPVHLQPYYRENFAFLPGDYPEAEAYYQRAVTIPLYPAMSDGQVERVISLVLAAARELRA
jgi:dTDP-4-amino-4,6-dideoxygalactose transaminase